MINPQYTYTCTVHSSASKAGFRKRVTPIGKVVEIHTQFACIAATCPKLYYAIYLTGQVEEELEELSDSDYKAE